MPAGAEATAIQRSEIETPGCMIGLVLRSTSLTCGAWYTTSSSPAGSGGVAAALGGALGVCVGLGGAVHAVSAESASAHEASAAVRSFDMMSPVWHPQCWRLHCSRFGDQRASADRSQPVTISS
ncbi:hypothetical protein Agsp01_10590 [Agromyces sp. NBRC 114283]|nr:hypothetical protein Agsp01_10590 [Agromyces sp. NBRC 114283]